MGREEIHEFSRLEREALYKTIFSRRDVREQFKSDSIPEEVLSRILTAAHHAPSVGFMQPWNFILVISEKVKQKVYDGFIKAHNKATDLFEGKKRDAYQKLKLEGILESPVNLCITCDRERSGPVVLGRTSMKDMDLYSSVCAVQNLWLAARAEGLGVGWVSIIEQDDLQDALGIPRKIIPIAYLCIGYVSHFNPKPDLESADWLKRQNLNDLIYFDQWEQKHTEESSALRDAIESNKKLVDQYFVPDKQKAKGAV